MTLFDDPPKSPTPDSGEAGKADSPLAERLRPRSLEEIVGQRELVGENSFLRRAIAADRVPSLILWGPPGTGKTTLARIIADRTASRFVPFSAVTSGIKEVKQVMADAARLRRSQSTRTLVFIDEIHRFNRAQQDAFLPYVESGDVVLIGATTENPSFEVNGALLSRCRVLVVEPLAAEDILELLRRALNDGERGLSGYAVEVDSEALDAIADLASGDARRALGLLESAVFDAAEKGEEGEGRKVGVDAIRRVVQRRTLLYDKSGEEHYNLISALHKSLRESDADASIYWLARMLAAGEEPLYVARRLLRFASEDIGLADPGALLQAKAAWDSYHRLGSPEGELALAQATLYLALAPKSNAAYKAYGEARRIVEERPAEPAPKVVRNAPTRLMKDLGYGKGYVYAPDTEEGVGGIDCLPESLAGSRFYEPKGEGFESELKKRLEELRRLQQDAREKAGPNPSEE